MPWFLSLLLITLSVSESDASSTSTNVMRQTIAQTSGRDVVVRTESAPPSADSTRVQVAWNAAHDRARVIVEAGDMRDEREVVFRAADSDAQRGRTLAFVALSMLPPDPPESAGSDPVTESPGSGPVTESPGSGPVTESPGSDPVTESPGSGPKDEAAHHALLDVLGVAAIGVGQNDLSTTFGASLGGTWLFHPRVGVRLSVDARGSEAPSARASLLWVAPQVGVFWTFFDAEPFALSALGTLGAGYQAVSRYSGDDDGDDRETRSQWVFAANAMLDGAWFFAQNVALSLSAGVEATSTRTQVTVGDESHGVLGPARVRLQLGVRVRF